jgi:hypothetical protein
MAPYQLQLMHQSALSHFIRMEFTMMKLVEILWMIWIMQFWQLAMAQ